MCTIMIILTIKYLSKFELIFFNMLLLLHIFSGVIALLFSFWYSYASKVSFGIHMLQRFYPSHECAPFSMVVRFLGESDLGGRERGYRVDSSPQWENPATKE